MCWLCLVPAAHAIRPPSPAELQLKEETPGQQQPAYGLVVAVDAEGRIGLFCVNDPLRYTDPTGHGPNDYTGASGRELLQEDDPEATRVVQSARQSAATVATVGRVVAEANPVVGAFNGAYEAGTGKDAMGSGATLSGKARVLAGIGAAASIIPVGLEAKEGAAVLKAGKEAGAVKEGIYSFKEGEATYIGQSGDLAKRLRAHELSGKKAPGVEATITEVSGGKTAREIAEHKQIQETTGGVPASQSSKVTNQRDPIGPNRQQLLKENP